MSGGVKHDQGKLRLDLITPEMTRALGNILTAGQNAMQKTSVGLPRVESKARRFSRQKYQI